MRFVFAAMALALHPCAASGAGPPDSTGTLLIVTADVGGARVFVNGRPAGVTPLAVDSLPPGAYALSVFHPAMESWFGGSQTDSVVLEAGDTVRMRASLLRRLHLVSDPAGVPVFADDSLLACTPVVLRGPFSDTASVLLRLPGAPPVRVRIVDSQGGILFHRFSLRPAGESGGAVSVLREERGLPPGAYFAGGAALLSGVAAAAWKVKADEVYAQYRTSRDPAARDRTRRLDTASAAALAAMQVSVGLLVYFIVSD